MLLIVYFVVSLTIVSSAPAKSIRNKVSLSNLEFIKTNRYYLIVFVYIYYKPTAINKYYIKYNDLNYNLILIR